MTDDDKKTPRGKGLRVPTDSEREVFRAQWASGVPVVSDDFEHEDTSPIDIFERAPRSASQDLVRKLRQNPERLIPFLGEFAEWVVTRMRERSSSEQSAMQELRELLSKPPNGATKRLEEQVKGLEQTVRELIAELRAKDDRIEDLERRVAPVEETIKSAKGTMWKAAIAVVTTIAGSAVAIITTWQAGAEKAGAAAERSANDRMRIDRLERLSDERLSDERPRAPRRDYDYDIAPRPAPLKKEP